MRRVAIAASLGVLAGICAALWLARRAPEPPPAVAAAPTSSGGRVRIDAVEPPEQVPGGLVVLRGRGFSIFPSDDALQDIKSYQRALAAVSITAGGLAAGPPNELADGRAQVLLPPELRPGRARVVLSVGGEWASAEVEVVSRLAVPQVEPGEPVPSFLSLDGPRFSRERGGESVSFAGGAEGLPDGSVIDVRLTFGGNDIGPTAAEVKDGRFAGQFRISGTSFFPGAYWVEAQFRLEKQTRDVQSRFERAFTEAADSGRRVLRHENGGARRVLQVGLSAEITDCAREQSALIAASATRGRALLEELAIAYGAAGRSGYVSAGKVDEAAWGTWLELRALAAFAKPVRAARREAMRARQDVLAEGGTLSLSRWREVVDGLRGELLRRLAEREEFSGRFVVLGDPEAFQRAQLVLGGVRDLSADWSRELYRNVGLSPDDGKDPRIPDVSPAQVRAELDALDGWVAEQPSRK